MNIYYACAIIGGRNDQPMYQRMVEFLQSEGNVVLNAVISGAGFEGSDITRSPREVYTRDTTWIDESDALIAEVSTPSHGVGYEIAYALGKAKPVLCLYQSGRRVSKMITGNTRPNLAVAPYRSIEEAAQIIQQFMKKITNNDG